MLLARALCAEEQRKNYEIVQATTRFTGAPVQAMEEEGDFAAKD
jgi:hypothetical protein